MREVLENDLYTHQLAEIQPNVRRSDEFIDAPIDLLSSDPEAGDYISGHLWRTTTHEAADIPQL